MSFDCDAVDFGHLGTVFEFSFCAGPQEKEVTSAHRGSLSSSVSSEPTYKQNIHTALLENDAPHCSWLYYS